MNQLMNVGIHIYNNLIDKKSNKKMKRMKNN